MDCWDLVIGEHGEPVEAELQDHEEPTYQLYLKYLSGYNHKNIIAFGMFSRSLAMMSDTILKARETPKRHGYF